MSWKFLDNQGRIKELLQSQGINPTHQIFSVHASGTYVTPAGCTAILVECIGAGGGSSGCAASGATTQASIGASGGGGAYAAKLIVNPSASYAYTVGQGGSAGTSSTGGGNGTDTNFGIISGSAIVVAKAGNGGADIENWNGSPAFSIGGSGGQAASCVGDITVSGETAFSWRYSTVYCETVGAAAAGPYGAERTVGGTRSGFVGGAGTAGAYPGGGAQPGVDTNNTARAGAAGADGLIVVTEFYGVRSTGGGSPSINFSSQDFSLGPPSSPVNGDIWYATNVDANGTAWQFRYNVSSASAYKWEFIGGAPVYVAVETVQTTSSTAYVDLATPGPTFTPARGGDYLLQFGADIFNNTLNDGGVVSPSIGGATPTDDTLYEVGTTASFHVNMGSKPYYAPGVAASAAIKLMYRAASGGTASFGSRRMQVVPIRVA